MISRCEFAEIAIKILTNKEKPRDTRIATLDDYSKKKLDVIFPMGINRWRGYVEFEMYNNVETILDYFKKQHNLLEEINVNALNLIKKLIMDDVYKFYNLHIDFEIGIDNNVIWIKFDRKSMVLTVIKSTIEEGLKFGYRKHKLTSKEHIFLMIEEDKESEITTTRLNMIKKVSENLLETQGFTICPTICDQNYILTTKSTSKKENIFNKCICGVVLNNNKRKEINLTKDNYLDTIIEKIKEINADRYSDGLSNKNSDGNNETIANACLNHEMLSLKPNVPVILKNFDELDKTIKSATFVLYNNVRISSILDKYNKLVLNNEYPKILPINEISEFEHIIDDESWDLIYNYIMKYPDVLQSSISLITKDNKQQLEFHIHNIWSFVTSLCHKFSSYYRRYRVLMSNINATEKTLSITTERLHLLRALHIIIKNVLSLLNIGNIHYM